MNIRNFSKLPLKVLSSGHAYVYGNKLIIRYYRNAMNQTFPRLGQHIRDLYFCGVLTRLFQTGSDSSSDRTTER